jgi:hypothetical protein
VLERWLENGENKSIPEDVAAKHTLEAFGFGSDDEPLALHNSLDPLANVEHCHFVSVVFEPVDIEAAIEVVGCQ